MTRLGAGYGTLYVVATPIGNLDDLSPRARAVLAGTDVVAAEDTRHSRGLLSSISAESRLIAYHEHNEQERLPELIAMLTALLKSEKKLPEVITKEIREIMEKYGDVRSAQRAIDLAWTAAQLELRDLGISQIGRAHV